MRAVSLIALAVLGCGSSGPPPSPAASRIALTSPAAASSDVEVARVNGRPVWGSCVAIQAVADTAEARARALRECVDFELLAQTAEQRGLAADPEVDGALRTALVGRLVTEYERRYEKPADFGATIEKLLDEHPEQQNRAELRASTYIRIPVAKNAPPEIEIIAKTHAERIAARVATESGMFGHHLVELATSIPPPPGIVVQHADVTPHPWGRLEDGFADALFAIPEIGRASGAVRTAWGWDVILWTGVVPAKISTREELAADVFPTMRRKYFTVWSKQFERELGIKIEIIEANLGVLDRVSAP